MPTIHLSRSLSRLRGRRHSNSGISPGSWAGIPACLIAVQLALATVAAAQPAAGPSPSPSPNESNGLAADSSLVVTLGGSFSFLDGLSVDDVYARLEIAMPRVFERNCDKSTSRTSRRTDRRCRFMSTILPDGFLVGLTQSRLQIKGDSVGFAALAVAQTVPLDSIPPDLPNEFVDRALGSAHVTIERLISSFDGTSSTENLAFHGTLLWPVYRSDNLSIALHHEVRKRQVLHAIGDARLEETRQRSISRLPDLSTTNRFFNAQYRASNDTTFTTSLTNSSKVDYDTFGGVHYAWSRGDVSIRMLLVVGVEKYSKPLDTSKSILQLTIVNKSPNLALGAEIRRHSSGQDEFGLYLASQFSVDKLANFLGSE